MSTGGPVRLVSYEASDDLTYAIDASGSNLGSIQYYNRRTAARDTMEMSEEGWRQQDQAAMTILVAKSISF